VCVCVCVWLAKSSDLTTSNSTQELIDDDQACVHADMDQM
jgi:hypothetical protein